MPTLNNPRSVIATSTMELILTPRPRAGYAGIKSRVGFRMITPSPGNGFVVGPRRRSGARFCPAFTAPVQASNPRLQPGGSCFWLWRARQPVDSGFQPEASEAPPVELAAPIWRPIAVRFFFQGPGDDTHNLKLRVRGRPGLNSPQRARRSKGPKRRSMPPRVARPPCSPELLRRGPDGGERDETALWRAVRPSCGL